MAKTTKHQKILFLVLSKKLPHLLISWVVATSDLFRGMGTEKVHSPKVNCLWDRLTKENSEYIMNLKMNTATI